MMLWNFRNGMLYFGSFFLNECVIIAENVKKSDKIINDTPSYLIGISCISRNIIIFYNLS